MVTGSVLSTSMVLKIIREGDVATNFSQAIRKFGTKFIAIHPIPCECKEDLYKNADPHERIEPDTCYVKTPDSINF